MKKMFDMFLRDSGKKAPLEKVSTPSEGKEQGLPPNPFETSLSDIGTYWGTDKSKEDHTFEGVNYNDIYEQYLRPLQNEPLKFLEIGIHRGKSLNTWKHFFPNAEIYGIDIDPGTKKYADDRINIEIGSQDDVKFLASMFPDVDEFDVILDDGSHIIRHIIASYDYLFFNRLKSGGIYIAEDLRCTYRALQTDNKVLETWPGMKYNDPEQDYDNNRPDLDEFFLKYIKDMDHKRGQVRSMHFWPMICLFMKV